MVTSPKNQAGPRMAAISTKVSLKLQPMSGYKRDVGQQQKPVKGTSHPCYIWL